MAAESIPKGIALKICEEVRSENAKRKFNVSKMQCWGCMKYAKGDADKMCFSNHPEHRGCNWVNKRYDKGIGNSG